MTPNELVLTFGGLHLCVKFGENRQRNATVRVMTHGQTHAHTHRQTDRQTQTDFIICPIAICYSYGTDNKIIMFTIKDRRQLFTCDKTRMIGAIQVVFASRVWLRQSTVSVTL